MAMRTAEDVANMEAELHDLRQQIENVSRQLLIADTERKGLKIENALLLRKCEDAAERATKMETIIQQVSFGLVAALKEWKDSREIAKAVRREVQEQQLGVGGADAATFLARRPSVRHGDADERGRDDAQPEQMAQPERPRVHAVIDDTTRTEQLRGAAEHVAPPPPFLRQPPASMRPGRIDHDLAARDSRLPPMGDYPREPIQTPTRETDDAALARLAGQIEGRTSR